MKKVFLGGTCAGSDWRDRLIEDLKITYFNPVVTTGEWNEAQQERELKEREESDYLLYVITPKMKGTYSIAEVIDDAHKDPKKTFFCVLDKDGGKTFSDDMKSSLEAVCDMVERIGGTVCKDLKEVAKALNKGAETPKKAADDEIGPLEKAMHLLELTTLVAEGKEPNIPGLDLISKNLDRRENVLKIRSKRFISNLGKLKGIIKKITEAAANEAQKPDTDERNASVDVETPESSKNPVPQVREVSASMNQGDKESVDLYEKRVTQPDGKNPSNVHDEMLGLTKKAEYNVDFGVGEQGLSKEEKAALDMLHGKGK
jgi:hypothetical protein